MRKILLFAAIVLIASACEKNAWSNFQIPEYDGAFTWQEVVRNADWCNRSDHAATVFDNKMWITGGYNSGLHGEDTYLEDVWYSTDGKHWTLSTDDAPWLGRRAHQMVTFDAGDGEAMYVIGGFTVDESTGYREYRNDIWRSKDGLSWEQVKESTKPELDDQNDWYPRFNHGCVVANHGGVDYIYLIGGACMVANVSGKYSMKYFNDVWRSADGENWEKLPANDFGIRSEHGIAVDEATGEIFIQGGNYGSIINQDVNFSTPVQDWQFLWRSTDGVNWVKDSLPQGYDHGYLYRAQHRIVHYQNTLYGFPGKNNQAINYAEPRYYAIWKRDQNGWGVDSKGVPFWARHSYVTLEFEDKVWILGGINSNSGPSNDVWQGIIE